MPKNSQKSTKPSLPHQTSLWPIPPKTSLKSSEDMPTISNSRKLLMHLSLKILSLNSLSKSLLNNLFLNPFKKLRLRSQNRKFHLLSFNNPQLLKKSQSNRKSQPKNPFKQLSQNNLPNKSTKLANKSQLKETKSNPEETTEVQESTEDQEKTDLQEKTEGPEKTEAQEKTEGSEKTEDPERTEAQEEKDKKAVREEDTIQINPTDKDPTTDQRTKKKRLKDRTHHWKENNQ